MAGRRPHCDIHLVLFTVPFRIGIPGNNIQLGRELEVIQRLKKFHHIDGDGQHAVFKDSMDFFLTEILDLMADETLPVQIQAVQAVFSVGHRAVDLGPVGVGMAPEGGPPGMV